MVIFAVLVGVKFKQGDITAVYVCACEEEGKNIYMDVCHELRKQNKAGKLKTTHLGLQQSPSAIWLTVSLRQ